MQFNQQVTAVEQRVSANPGAKLAERDFHFVLPAPSADARGALLTYPRLIDQTEDALREWVRTLRLPAIAGG